jgi:hypothetical protein
LNCRRSISGETTIDPWSLAVDGGELQADVERLRARRHVDMIGEHVDRIARPVDLLAVAHDVQVDDLVELAARRMRAGQPFREEQDHMARLGDREGLLGREDAALRVGRVDVERHRARIGNVARIRDGVHIGHRLRLRILGERGAMAAGREQGHEKDATDHQGKPFGKRGDAVA